MELRLFAKVPFEVNGIKCVAWGTMTTLKHIHIEVIVKHRVNQKASSNWDNFWYDYDYDVLPKSDCTRFINNISTDQFGKYDSAYEVVEWVKHNFKPFVTPDLKACQNLCEYPDEAVL